MNEVKELIRKLATDPKGKELLGAAKEPKTMEEAADMYLGFAKELGVEVSREEILAFLQLKEKNQQEAAAKAEESVKMTLDDAALDKVAGGSTYTLCDETFNAGEWCWASDSCSLVITCYTPEPVKEGADDNMWPKFSFNDSDDDFTEVIFNPNAGNK